MPESSLKTGEPPVATRYRVGDLVVDLAAGVVRRGEETVALSPLTFHLLVALVRRAPQAVQRQELLETVWPNEFVNEDTLWQRVRLLREALGDVAEEPRYLASVRGWGYKIVPNVERLEDQPAPIRALAVLPLANISGDPQQEYFADGMTETLISSLAKIRALKVISRTSVMHYKHVERRLPQIARELGVDAVVEGTALAAGGRVRVSVQLIRAATDERLWAEIYDRELEDVFALHADLARCIAGEIRALITPEERERLATHRRVNPAAHESELRARYFLAKFTPSDLDRGIAYFEQAISQDPLFAEAQSGLALACMHRAVPLGAELTVARQRELLGRGKTAAKQALAIDSTLP
jgi:TolB-like protein